MVSYLGYGEMHQRVHGQGGRFRGNLVGHNGEYWGLSDKLDDPHDRLNLAQKVKDKQLYSKAQAVVGYNQTVPKSSKGSLLKDYTRPEKRGMVAPAAEHTSNYMRSTFAT